MDRARRSRARYALGIGFVAGVATAFALALNIAIASVLPIAMLVWWMTWLRAPYSGLAGYLLGFGLTLGAGAVGAADRCAALNAAGGNCTGPDLLIVGALAGVPAVLAAAFALLGRVRERRVDPAQ